VAQSAKAILAASAADSDQSETGATHSSSGFWSTLNDSGIPYRSLIALLFHFMDSGQKFESGHVERQLCLQATSLYFIFLALPGSGAFKIFHPVLYQKALSTFKLSTKLKLGRLSPRKKKPPSARPPKSKHVPPPRNRLVRTTSVSSANLDEAGMLSEREVRDLTNALNAVIYDFHVFLDHHPLKRSLESMELTVSELVELTHLETSFANLDFGHRNRRSDLSALAFNAYCALEKICHPLHGDLRRSLLLILKCLLPAILMTHRGSSEIAPRGLTIIREHSLHFVKHLMRRIGQESHGAIEVLIQHLALQVPDKAEYRAKTSLAIVTLMRDLSVDIFNRVVRWIFAWAHNEKVAHRQFALEVMGRLMQENERSHGNPQDQPSEGDKRARVPTEEPTTTPDNLVDNLPEPPLPSSSSYLGDLVSHKFIFGVIFSRCRDVSATVRAKALQTLADITAAHNPTIIMVIQSMMEKPTESSTPMGNDDMVDFVELLGDEKADLARIHPLPSAACFTEFLRKRALDDSVYVRKNALQVIVNVLKFSEDLVRHDLVSILSEHCRDSSLMVRKLMATSLTDLLKMYSSKPVMIRHWVDGLFPLILDGVWECLFGNLVPFSDASREAHFLPWKILQSSEELKMTKYLSRACGFWAKEGQLKANVIIVLKTHVHTENNDLAWLLLSLISAHVSIADPHFVMEYFNTSIHTPEGVGLYTLQQVLRVLFSSVIRLSSEEQRLLQKDLILLVKRFAIPPELIPTAVDIATVVSNIESGDNLKAFQSAVDSWTSEIIETIDRELSEKILNPSGEDVEDVPMMRKIFTLEDLASIMPTSQTQSSQPPPCAFQPTTRLQALTIVTLAKMCLQHEDMAKKIIPAFGQILDTSGDNAVKNNIMYALTDMCVRYASLVDPLIPQITACLKDDSLAVRRSTLITLIHLLQEDYLKMSGRGAFFFRIMQTLNDDSDEMRHLTTFYLQQRLVKRKPKVMFQHFTESLFHFNEYEIHETYNKFTISDREKRLFSMKGVEYREDRMKLYRFMLECMSDEQRFQTTYRLCKDILEGAVEGQVVLGHESYDLLRDTFRCLSCEEIKLASLKSKADEPDEANNTGIAVGQTTDMSGAIQSALKKNIISQVVKKNVIENIIPIIIALKHRLEELGSGLIDDLMNYLRELMKDYKNEVKDMLAADKNLATEIEKDLKKWEEEQKKLEEARREAESQEKSPTQRDLLLRAVVESAVNVFQQKQKDLEQRREAGEIIDDDSLSSSQSGDPLDEFLTKNVGKAGDVSTTNLSTLLSPKVVVQDVLGDVIQCPTPKSTARSIGRSPRPSLTENRGEAIKRKLISSYDEPLMVVAEESILMTEADQEHLAGEVLSELHSVHQGHKSIITSVPTLAEINKELEIVVSQTKQKQRLKNMDVPDDGDQEPKKTPVKIARQGEDVEVGISAQDPNPPKTKSPVCGSPISGEESTNRVDEGPPSVADGPLKKTDEDNASPSDMVDVAVNQSVAIDEVPEHHVDLDGGEQAKVAGDEEETCPEKIRSTTSSIETTETAENSDLSSQSQANASKLEFPSSPREVVPEALPEETHDECWSDPQSNLIDQCETEEANKLKLNLVEESHEEVSKCEDSPHPPVAPHDDRKRRNSDIVEGQESPSKPTPKKQRTNQQKTREKSKVKEVEPQSTEEASEESNALESGAEICHKPKRARAKRDPITKARHQTQELYQELVTKGCQVRNEGSPRRRRHHRHHHHHRYSPAKAVEEKVPPRKARKGSTQSIQKSKPSKTRGTKRKVISQESADEPKPSTKSVPEQSSPPKRRRTTSRRLQEAKETGETTCTSKGKDDHPTHSTTEATPAKAANKTLAVRATEMETTATPKRSYQRVVGTMDKMTPKSPVPISKKVLVAKSSPRSKRRKALPFLRNRRKSMARSKKSTTRSSILPKDQENRVVRGAVAPSSDASSEESEITFNLSKANTKAKPRLVLNEDDPELDAEVSFKAPELVPLLRRLPQKSILSHSKCAGSLINKSALKEVSFKEPSLGETSTTRRFQLATKAKEKRQSLSASASASGAVSPASSSSSVSISKSTRAQPSLPLPRHNLAKTHQARLKNVLRAISTPNRQGVSQDNLTFLEQSHDLSAIPILSPPSTRKKRPQAHPPPDQPSSDGSALSFRRAPIMSALEQTFTQELAQFRWKDQIRLVRLFGAPKPELQTVKTTWMRCVFKHAEPAARLFHHLNEQSTLELSAIQGLAKSMMGFFLSESPSTLEEALQHQGVAPLPELSPLDELMLELLVPFKSEDIMGVIRRSALHENFQLQWNRMGYLISKFLLWMEGAEALLEDFIATHLAQSIIHARIDRFQAVLFVVRAACSASKSGLFPNYRQWCQRAWKPAHQPWMSQPEKWATFLDFLTRMVPYERAVCLTAHIAVPFSHALTPSMRALWSDYCHLARTRLSDFKSSNRLASDEEPSSIFQQPFLGSSSESLPEVKHDVTKALAEFEVQGRKIPQKILEASIFRKAYFQGQFLPCLLSAEFSGPGQEAFIEELVKKGKIPRKLLNQ
ncbi:hypothetical protein TCAL_11306, partial [Tigriopus californicus]